MRQFAAAIALIGVCLLVIHLVFGLDQLVNFSEKRKFEESDKQEFGTVVPIKDKNGKNTTISIIARGRVHIPHEKDVPMPDGSILKLPVYVLDAEDNEPAPDTPGEILLHRVVVKFYKVINKGAENTEAIHAATMHARQAFIHLGKDSEGSTTILGDRDIRLYDVHFETTDNAPIQDLKMDVAELHVRQSDRGTELRTPNEFMPFVINLDGNNPLTLVGDGLVAIMPNEDNTADDKALELHVTRNPVLTGDNLEVRAKGSFDYIEDSASGIARVSINRGVEAEFRSATKKSAESISPRNVVARCNTFKGELLRSKKDKTQKKGTTKKRSKSEMGSWRQIELFGSKTKPVTVTAEQGLLRSEKLEALPAADGQPYLFVATGNPDLTHTDPKTGTVTVFTAERRIHLVRIESLLRPLHPAFHGPLVPRLTQNLVIFEGISTVTRDDLTLTADKGLRILQSSRDNELRLIRGVGGVEMDQSDLHVTSNKGFTLSQQGDEQILQLGPAKDDPTHWFRVNKTGGQALSLDGTGYCRLVRSSTNTTLFIRSPKEDLIVDTVIDDKPAHLSDIHILTAHLRTVDKKEILEGFVAEGKRCHLEGTVKDRILEGFASRIVSPAGVDISLFGDAQNPAILIEGKDSEIKGARIELHPLLNDDLVVQVFGGPARQAHATFQGKSKGQPSKQEPTQTRVSLKSDEIHWLPYLLPRFVLHAHGRSLYRSRVFARNLAAPHVIAKKKVWFYTTSIKLDAKTGEQTETNLAEAKGDLFVMRVSQREGARQHGFLRGNPASFSNSTKAGREAKGQAKLVQFTFVDDSDYSVELLSEESSKTILTLAGDPKSKDRELDRVRVTCTGDIRGDTLTIRFLGPVHIQGLRPDGSLDPDGIDLRAESMVLHRHNEIITKIIASGNVKMKWTKIHARGEELILEPENNTCVVKDTKNGTAVVSLPGKSSVIGTYIRANYITKSYTIWDMRSPKLSQKD